MMCVSASSCGTPDGIQNKTKDAIVTLASSLLSPAKCAMKGVVINVNEQSMKFMPSVGVAYMQYKALNQTGMMTIFNAVRVVN